MGNILTRRLTVEKSATLQAGYEDALALVQDPKRYFLLDETLSPDTTKQDADNPNVWHAEERVNLPLLPSVALTLVYSALPDGCRCTAHAALGVQVEAVTTIKRPEQPTQPDRSPSDEVVWTEVATISAPFYSYWLSVGSFRQKRVDRFATLQARLSFVLDPSSATAAQQPAGGSKASSELRP